MFRLYRAWSMVDNFRGYNQVKLNWFVVGRQKPVAPYEDLIRDYQEDDEIWYDHIYVKELLTESEVEELRDYIKKTHNSELQTEIIELPVKRGILSYGLLMMAGQGDFYFLADEKDYNLSVPILAYYDLEGCPAVPPEETPQEETKNAGIQFLELFLKEMGLPPVHDTVLQNAVDKIYDEHRLHVVREEEE